MSSKVYEVMAEQWAELFIESSYETFKAFGGVDQKKWQAYRDELPCILGRVIWREMDKLQENNPRFNRAKFISAMMRQVAKRYEEKRRGLIIGGAS